jgi:hypothetical protein
LVFFATVDQLHVAPAGIRQAAVEQPVLKRHAGDRDRLTLEQGEIEDPQHAGLVLLQEHHLLFGTVQGLPLLNAALQGALAPVPLLAWERALQVQQQGLGFQLRCLLQHRHQHAVPDISQRVGAGAPVAAPLLLLLRLQFTPVDPLGAAHRDPHRISGDLLTQATGPFGHVPLLDPQRQRGGHRGLQTVNGALLSRPETRLCSCADPPS